MIFLSEKSVLTSKVRSELDLLERHVTLLKAVWEHQPIGIIRLSEMLSYPQHKVRYTLRVLEQEGLLRPSAQGAVITEGLQPFLSRLGVLLDEMSDTANSLRKSLKGQQWESF